MEGRRIQTLIRSNLSDWEEMSKLALGIITQCEDRGVLTPRSIEWSRDPPSCPGMPASTFWIERDGLAVRWVLPDWEMERFGAEWMGFVTDHLVTSFASRAGDSPRDPRLLPEWTERLAEEIYGDVDPRVTALAADEPVGAPSRRASVS